MVRGRVAAYDGRVEDTSMTSVRLIKRYANRKLYDTSESRYVKLEEIADMVDRGEEVQIIDNETKEDITRISLAQILVRRGRTGSLGDSMTSLRDLVVNTGEQLTKRISDPVTTLRSSVEDSVQKLLKTGEERAEKGRDQFRSWVAQNTLAIEDIQKRFDERVRITIGRLDLVGQINELQDRVDQLEKTLAELSKSAK